MSLTLTASPEILGAGVILGVGELPATSCVVDVGITNPGSGYTAAPTVAFSSGGGANAAGTVVIAGGVVTGVVVTNRGSGYTSAPTLAFGTSGGGTGVAAVAVMALGPPASYTNFSKIEDIGPPEPSRAKVETTSHDQINKKNKFIGGFSGQSDPTLNVLYQKICASTIDAMYNSGATYGWKITFPDRSTQEFNAFIINAGITSPLKDTMRQKLTLAIDDSTVFWTQG